MRSDSEVLAQIAGDVAEIKAAMFGKNKAQEPFRTEDWPVHEFRPHGATWEHVERLAREREAQVDASIKADLAAKGDSDLIDLRKLEGRVCKSPWRLLAKSNKGSFVIQIGMPFRVIYVHPEQKSVMVECDEKYGWISIMREVEVIDEPPRLNYRYSDVVITTNIVTSISHASDAFAIVATRLKPTVAFKPERLALSETWFAIYRDRTTSPTVVQPGAEDLTIMRIRACDKDVITAPVSA